MKGWWLSGVMVFMLIASSMNVAAHCPLCTGAIGAAAVSAKMMGVDTSIIGVFVGAFGISTGIWIARKLKRRIPLQTPLIVLASFLLTIIPLYPLDVGSFYLPVLLVGKAGTVFNKVYWIGKLLFGSVLGAVVSWGAYGIHIGIKKFNGRVLFPFQGVAITLLALILAAIPLYLVTQ